MPSIGPNSVTAGATITGAGPPWLTPGNVTASDDTRARHDTNGLSEFLAATGPGFALPAVAPDGFLIEIEAAHMTSAGTLDEVWLTKDGTTAVGNNLLASPQALTTTETYYSVGGPTELGGTTWTEAAAEASTFGVLIKATRSGSDVRIDHVRITVYYTAAGGTTHDGAGVATLTATTAGAGAITAGGAGVASLTATTAGVGSLLLSGAGAAVVTVTTAGAGSLLAGGAGVAGLTATTAGAGAIIAGGAGLATLVVTTAGAGEIVGAGTTHDGAGIASLTVAATAAASVILGGAGSASLVTTTAADGQRIAEGAGAATLTVTTAGAGALILSGAGVASLTVIASADGTIDADALPSYGVGSVTPGEGGALVVVTSHPTSETTVRGSS